MCVTRIFKNPVEVSRPDSTNTMKKNIKNVFRSLLLVILLQAGAGRILAQDASGNTGGEGLFKKLLILKFDSSKDGSLTGLEKGKAVDFLNRQDKDRDGQISLKERTSAINELNQMSDLGRTVVTSKMTPDERNVAQRKANWGNFIKKLPHSKEGRTFTKVPGDAGFKMKGDDFVDPTKIKGVAPGRDRITAVELNALMSKKAADDKLERTRKGVMPQKIEPKPAKPLGKKDYYAGTTILASGGEHTVIPVGAVLNVPLNLTGMVVEKPQGKLLIWPKFMKKYARFVATKEVSWQTAKGEDPISEKDKKAFSIGSKVVVAVFNKNPISVMEPKEEEAGVVGGAVASDSTSGGARKEAGGK